MGKSPLLNSLNSFTRVWSWLLLPSESPGITYHLPCLLRFHVSLSRQTRKAWGEAVLRLRAAMATAHHKSHELFQVSILPSMIPQPTLLEFPNSPKGKWPYPWLLDSCHNTWGEMLYLLSPFTQWEDSIFWKTPAYEEVTYDNPRFSALGSGMRLLHDFLLFRKRRRGDTYASTSN